MFLLSRCPFHSGTSTSRTLVSYVNMHVIAVGVEITAGCVEQATCCESLTDELLAKDTRKLLWCTFFLLFFFTLIHNKESK